jgi:ABC-type transport system involved in multi-copper enzyme maturation permease subunit
VIWLTWRQFRSQFAVVFGVLVVVAIILALTGHSLVDQADAYLKSCRTDTACGNNPVLNADGNMQTGLTAVLLLAPALIGIFWGAPLVARELETGTYRLGWSQSITRNRWLGVKLGVVGLVSVAVAGLLSLMVTWWFSPIDTVNANRFGLSMFGLRDIAPLGYAAFAFALGVTAGVLMRRTLPAMATTLVAYVATRLAFTFWVRPHLMSPSHTDVGLKAAQEVGFSINASGGVQLVGGSPDIPNAWVYSSDVVNNAGQAPTTSVIKAACPNLPTGPPAGSVGGSGGGGVAHVSIGSTGRSPAVFQDCIAKLAANYHEVVTYQPASRFWAFQGIETAIFFALALLLGGLCFWWVRRRLS